MSMLGSTEEADEYARWAATRAYRVELAALIIANPYGATGPTGKPTKDDYRAAEQVVDALKAGGAQSIQTGPQHQ